MNKDFEKAIRDMMKSGKSMKEVMDALGETWNQIEKSDSEQSVLDWRKEVTNAFEEQWREKRANMNPRFIVEFLLCALAPNHPEWSLKDIQNGVEAIYNVVQIIEKAIGKDTIDMLGIMNREFDNLISKALGKTCQEDTDSHQSSTKDKERKSAPEKFFTVHTCADPDAAVLKSFLNLLGL